MWSPRITPPCPASTSHCGRFFPRGFLPPTQISLAGSRPRETKLSAQDNAPEASHALLSPITERDSSPRIHRDTLESTAFSEEEAVSDIDGDEVMFPTAEGSASADAGKLKPVVCLSETEVRKSGVKVQEIDIQDTDMTWSGSSHIW